MRHLPDLELSSLKRRWCAFTFAFTLAGLLFFSACQKTGTGPGTTPPAPPDTTSHNFSWQTFTFGGEHGSSVLQDVAIINENDIWAVGEIHTAQTDTYDSLGNWQPPFNAVHWNGVKWELKRIFYNYQGSNFFSTIPSLFAFDKNDIWFGNFTHWNGDKFESIVLNISFPSRVNKIWGASSDDVYIVGNSGLIAHYDGQGWQKIESGTTTNANDIWGYVDPKSGEKTVLATVTDRYSLGEIRLFSISKQGVKDTLNWSPSHKVYTVWLGKQTSVYAGGAGLFQYRARQWNRIQIPDYFITRIRGSSKSNLMVVGAFGLVAHYNGSSWKTYSQLIMMNGQLEGLAVKDRLAIAVGQLGNSAVIVKGKQFKL